MLANLSKTWLISYLLIISHLNLTIMFTLQLFNHNHVYMCSYEPIMPPKLYRRCNTYVTQFKNQYTVGHTLFSA